LKAESKQRTENFRELERFARDALQAAQVESDGRHAIEVSLLHRIEEFCDKQNRMVEEAFGRERCAIRQELQAAENQFRERCALEPRTTRGVVDDVGAEVCQRFERQFDELRRDLMMVEQKCDKVTVLSTERAVVNLNRGYDTLSGKDASSTVTQELRESADLESSVARTSGDESFGDNTRILHDQAIDVSAWRDVFRRLAPEVKITKVSLLNDIEKDALAPAVKDESRETAPRTPLTPRTLTQRIEKKEAELDVVRRAVKNQRLREVELKQSSVSTSLDNLGDAGNYLSLLKPLEQRVTIADDMFPDLGREHPVDHLASIDKEKLGSSYLDMSTTVDSPPLSLDHSRSTCSRGARERISSVSARVGEIAPSFCGKTSGSGSMKVRMDQQLRSSHSMNLPICSVGQWGDRGGSANLVVEGGREQTRGVNGNAHTTNDEGGRGLMKYPPTRSLSRRGHHVPTPPHLCSPSQHGRLSPARGARRSSRLKEW